MDTSTQDPSAGSPRPLPLLSELLPHPRKSFALNFNLFRWVSKITPWVAPIPSAFFVARSSMNHLGTPLPIAIVLAAAIELLGLTSVHTWLRLSNWNLTKRKSDPGAPTHLAVLLTFLYFAITLGMITLLEVFPGFSQYMPAVTPLLTVIGAFNLALLSQQEQREAAVRSEREARKIERLKKREIERSGNGQHQGKSNDRPRGNQAPVSGSNPENREKQPVNPGQKLTAEEALNVLVKFFEQNPAGSYSAAGRAAGRSKSWVVWALNELESEGRIYKNNGQITVTRSSPI